MQIQPNERDKIAIWFGSGVSAREIGRRLGRDHTVIDRELKRNRYDDGYIAIHAQTLAHRRTYQIKKRCWWQTQWLYSYVLEKLGEGWSPEQISGRLKLKRGYQVISHESIYRFIYDPENQDKKLWEYLTRKQRRRYRKYGRKVQKVIIPNRVSIHLRDKRVERRKMFGHWEGDSIIGQQTKSKIIHTEVERKTRYLQALVINSKSSTDTIEAQKKIFDQLPAKTVTMDNGTEFVKHQELNEMGIKTFFADPYCSGQRGTNENTNGLIRRYLPKKTSFENLSQADLDDIVFEINNRPRKVLKFSTPFEALQKSLLVNGGAFAM